MIFLSQRVTADAEGGLKNRAHQRSVLQGVGGGQPPTSTHRVYTCALLATTILTPLPLQDGNTKIALTKREPSAII